MSKQQWIVIGVIAAIAVASGFLIKRKNDNSNSGGAQSQLPAEQAEANYNVPPNIGVQTVNTGGANFPQGENGYMYTIGQAQALPSSGNGK